MKASVFAVLLVVAGAFALPAQEIETRQERIVTGSVRRAIEQIRAAIVDAGLDPLVIDRYDYRNVIVPLLVDVTAFVDTLEFTGSSNIQINNLSFNVLTNRFRFDLALPQLRLSVGNSGITANVFGTRYTGSLSGSTAINQIRIVGDVRVRVGLISGISIRSLSIELSLGGIDSDLNLVVLETDYSDDVNNFLGVTIPETLARYRTEINQYLEDFILSILEQIL